MSFAMEVWFKILCLLTLKVFTSAVLAVAYGEEYVLTPQGPREATAGASPILNCSYTFMDNTRLRVTWWFGQTAEPTCKISNQIWLSSSLASANETKPKNNGMEVAQLMGDNWSTLELKNVTQNYSGWYFCQVIVEIPNLQSICSNGTKLNITNETVPYIPPVVPQEDASWLMRVTLGAGAVLLAVLSVGSIWMIYRRMKGRVTENPIYENMHPVRKSQALPSGRQRVTLQTPPRKPVGTLEESTSSDIKLPRLHF
nr:uncharacterized protein LOC111860370 isoform X1 [Paramormyrops kingsleyae]